MKRAVSVSLGSSTRDKRVEIEFKGQAILVERIGTNGDVARAQQLFAELDGQVDCLSVGGVDLELRFDGRAYPLYAARKLVKHVHHTPVVDGQGLKNTLERRVFELAAPFLDGQPHYQHAFLPMVADRIGMAEAVCEVTDKAVFGDLMVGLGLPLLVHGMRNYRRVLKVMLPLVSRFPMSMLYYDSIDNKNEPKYERYWKEADLLAGDFLFMSKVLPEDLGGKTIVTNTTTTENLDFLQARGISTVITTTPRYDGRSFGTNMMEAVLTAYSGKGRLLTNAELNNLIDEVGLRPTVSHF
jgi:hypothetical protein